MATKKTVTVYKNGTNNSGEIFEIDPVYLPIDSFAIQVSDRLGSDVTGDLKFYNENGVLIDESRHIGNEDTVYYYVLRGEEFVKLRPPSPPQKMEGPFAVNYILELKFYSDEPEPKVIKINVGGVVFETLFTTLTKYPDSKLARMFHTSYDGPNLPRVDGGAYFLDRDPKYFGPLLNFLRTGKIVLDPGISLEGVIQEAAFFEIPCIPPNLE